MPALGMRAFDGEQSQLTSSSPGAFSSPDPEALLEGGQTQASEVFSSSTSGARSVSELFYAKEGVSKEDLAKLSGPTFTPGVFNSLVASLQHTPIQDCSTDSNLLVFELFVNIGDARGVIERPQDYFQILSSKAVWDLVNKHGQDIEQLQSDLQSAQLQSELGHVSDSFAFAMSRSAKALGMPTGLRLIEIGNKRGNFRSLKRIKKALSKYKPGSDLLKLSFAAGWDFRSCWGDIVDLEGRPVCGEAVMNEFLQEVPGLKPIKDDSGQSGSTIVTNLRSFIIKNAKDQTELDTLDQAAPKIHQLLGQRQQDLGGCWNTAVAPICAVILEPGQAGWLLMRKISAPDYTPKQDLYLEGKQMSVTDLKGPKFSGYKDGKTWVTSLPVLDVVGHQFGLPYGMWKGKDPGFVTLFPNGIPLAGCGSRDAQITFAKDTEMLADMSMTDYSFFGSFYQKEESDDQCLCDATTKPRFPLVLTSSATKGNSAGLRMTVGIIDWLEQSVNTAMMSTMKPPDIYKEYFMLMWGSYFQVPKREVRATRSETYLIEAKDHQKAEVLRLFNLEVREVIAIQKMKWSDTKVKAGRFNVYARQIEYMGASGLPSGGSYKVFAGQTGKVVDIARWKQKNPKDRDGLIVQWDNLKGFFLVHPEQIVGAERRFQAANKGAKAPQN